jgi:hypothetical protein
MSNDDRDGCNHQSYLTRENDSNPKINFDRNFKELEKKHKALLEKNAQREQQKAISCTYCKMTGHLAKDCHRQKRELEVNQSSGKQALVANNRKYFQEDSGSESEFQAAYMMGRCSVREILTRVRSIQEVDPEMPPLSSDSDSDDTTKQKTVS